MNKVSPTQNTPALQARQHPELRHAQWQCTNGSFQEILGQFFTCENHLFLTGTTNVCYAVVGFRENFKKSQVPTKQACQAPYS